MQKTVLLGLIICTLVLVGVATRNAGLLALSLPLMVYLGAGLLLEPSIPQLEITRTISTARTTPSEPVIITLTITNQGRQLAELHLMDIAPFGLTLIEGDTNLLVAPKQGQTVTLEYTVKGRRGLYQFDEIKVVAKEPLGLFSSKTTFSAPGQFVVMPEVVRVRRVAIRPPRTGVYSGLIPARQGGPGIEFFGVRQYQPGDPTRWINERAGARYQQTLFVNEFEQERVVDVGLILDARAQSDARAGWDSLFEHSIQATATLADAFIGGSNRVGLFIYGRYLNWTFPGYGKTQRERIFRSLAKAEQGSGKVFEKLHHLPTQLFPVRSQLVLVSPLLPQDPEMLIRLRARGYRLMVISPDPISFEQRSLKSTQTTDLAARLARVERTLILDKLRQAEIQVVDWPVETPFHHIANIALSRLPYQRGQAAL